MNKIFVFFLLFLVGSMGFVAAPNTVHADSQLDILVQIAQNTKEHIKTDIDRLGSVSQEVNDMYNEGVTKTDLLLQAVENEDVASARQHFISAMIAFKQTSLKISENQPKTVFVSFWEAFKGFWGEARGASQRTAAVSGPYLWRCGKTAIRHQNGANTMCLCTFARTAAVKPYRQVTFSDLV